MKIQGFDSRTQGLLFYFAFAAFWGVVLLGIQAILIPKARTTTNNTWLVCCAAVFVVLTVAYLLVKRRGRRRAGRASR